MKIVVLLSIFVSVAICTIGVDISTAVSTADLSCLAKQGYSFSIIRCFQSTGSVDPNCASNVANSHAAGMENVDIYMFPCFKCGNAFDQMSALLNYTQGKGVKYNTLWLDIEGTQYWGSVSDNVAFMQQLLEAGEHLGALMGVYTSSSQWTPIMGSSTIGSAYPVWYAHYNNEQSFSDFTPFGGWKTPNMKQYNGDQTVCGVGVDLNWFPGGDTTTGTTTHAAATTATHAATTATHAATTTHDTATTATHAATTHAATTHAAATSGDHSAAGTTGTQTSQSSYSGSGSSSSDSGSDFRFLDRAIYNAKLGGNKIPLAKESPVKKDAYIKKDTNTYTKQDTNTKKETNTEKDTNTKKEIPTVKEAPKMKAPSTVREAKKISVKFTEVEDALQKGEHFKVLEEKAFNKF